MDKEIKLSASVISRIGVSNLKNETNYYMNGKCLRDKEISSVQSTIQVSGSTYLFAVSDQMDAETADRDSSISFTAEISKYYNEIAIKQSEFSHKLEELNESAAFVSNLLHSVLSGTADEDIMKPAFAAVFIDGGKGAVLNMGECRVCLLRRGTLRQLSSDYRKAERLLKMGIISDEQAEILSDRLGRDTAGKLPEIKRSDIFSLKSGDVFVITNRELGKYIDDERLMQIVASNRDCEASAGELVKEALNNGASGDLAAMVVRIEEAGSEFEELEVLPGQKPRENKALAYSPRNTVHKKKVVNKRKKLLKKYISAASAIIIIFGVIFGMVKMWSFITKTLPEKESEQTSGQVQRGDAGGVTTPDDNDMDFEPGEEQDYENGTEPSNPSGTQRSEAFSYQVKSGDTLYSLSMRFYNDPSKVDLIMEANGLTDHTIRVGQVLIIPPAD